MTNTMKKTCETCGCQVYDPFGGTLKLHDEEKCRGSQLEYKSNTPRTKCTCLDDNKLTQALCPIHGTPTPRTNYNHVSHTHCWEQGGHPPCGIPMEKHTQCCLCDLKVPRPRTWEDIMVTDLFMLCVEWSKGNFDMGKTIRERILAKISTIEDEAVRRERERMGLGGFSMVATYRGVPLMLMTTDGEVSQQCIKDISRISLLNDN